MSDYSLTLVPRLKQAKIIYDMAKINIKFEKTIPFGEIIHVMEIKANIDNANMIQMNLLMPHKHHVC